MSPLEPVRPDRPLDRRILLVALVVLVGMSGFIVGRQSGAPSSASSPRAPAGTFTFGPTPTVAAAVSPLVRPAVVASELASAAEALVAPGSWALRETSGRLRCRRLPSIELTASEAAQARTAWPRLAPVTTSAGEVVTAASSSGLHYALVVSLDPSTRPTLLDPAITAAGVAFLDLGPYLPDGQYVVMVARLPSQGSYDSFEAAGLIAR